MKYLTEHRSYFDVAQLVLGVGLFLAPWILGFPSEAHAAWSAWIAGGAMAILAGFALGGQLHWTSWASLIAGLWAIVAPWALGFTVIAAAMWAHVIVGAVVGLIALGELVAIHSDRTRVAA